MPRYNTQLMEDSSFEYIFLVEVHLYKLINKSNTLSIFEPLPTLIFSGKLAMKNPTSIAHTTLHLEMLTFPPSHLYFTSQDWYMYPPVPTNFNVLFINFNLQKSHPHFFSAFWSCQPNEHAFCVSEHTPPSFRWAPKLRSSIRDAPWRRRCPCSGRPSPTPRPAEKKLVVLGGGVPGFCSPNVPYKSPLRVYTPVYTMNFIEFQ